MAVDNRVELITDPHSHTAAVDRNVSEAAVARLQTEYTNAENALNALIDATPSTVGLRDLLVKENELKHLIGSTIVESLKKLQDPAHTKLETEAKKIQLTQESKANEQKAKVKEAKNEAEAKEFKEKQAEHEAAAKKCGQIIDAHKALNTARLAFAQKKNDLQNLRKCQSAITKINLNFDLPSSTAHEQAALEEFRERHSSAISGTGGGPSNDSPVTINLADSLTAESNTLVHKADPNLNVTFIDNKFTYSNPESGALAVRAKGWHNYKFEKVSMLDGGTKFIEATKQMIMVGIENITFDGSLLLQAQSLMSSSDYAYFEQLKRICDASRSTYQDEPGNTIFDKKGLSHVVATFKRLANDEDRRAYLKLLNPTDNMAFFANFIKQLKDKDIMFGSQTPEEYFQTKIVKLPHRKHALKKSIGKLHEDDLAKLAEPKVTELRSKATSAERVASFNAIDPTLKRFAWNNLSANTGYRTEILQAYLAELATAIEQGNDARKAEIKQNLRELLRDTKAEEIHDINRHLKNTHAYSGTNLAQNLSLIDLKSVIQDLPGCKEAAKQFSPQSFFMDKLVQEMPKQFLLPPQANTAQNDLTARIQCYKDMMELQPDQSFDSRLKQELKDIINHFEKSHPGQGWVKQLLCNATNAVFNDKDKEGEFELRDHLVRFVEDVNTRDERDPWSSLERMQRSNPGP